MNYIILCLVLHMHHLPTRNLHLSSSHPSRMFWNVLPILQGHITVSPFTDLLQYLLLAPSPCPL